MRVALYARVSTEDQAKHGISIEAQLAALHAWAEQNGHDIVGEYVDAGISGKKPPSKRPKLSKFFSDLDAGLSVDVLVFCKLDRFFRSVKLYYQAIEVLEKHHVAWQAIQEDYETVTASGRFKVNIMLGVAENEADRTAERIKTVFQHKVDMGQAITRCQPFGYTIKDKRVVQDENAPIAKEMFEFFAATGNTYATRDMIQEKYGIRLNYESVYRFLQNPIYVGRYRDNPNYCEPLISSELFDKIQADFAERRKTKRAPSGRVYLFSGLIVCAECGRKMTSVFNKGRTGYYYYRCPGHFFGKLCSNAKHIAEAAVESELLSIISASIAGISQDYKFPERETPTVYKSAINQKLSRLKELYIDGDITKDEYTRQKESLTKLLNQPQTEKQTPPKVFGDDFLTDYQDLTRDQKRQLWHSTVDHIVETTGKQLTVYFLP